MSRRISLEPNSLPIILETWPPIVQRTPLCAARQVVADHSWRVLSEYMLFGGCLIRKTRWDMNWLEEKSGEARGGWYKVSGVAQ